MARMLLLLAICLLSGCYLGDGTVAADVVRLYPGCQLDKLNPTRPLAGDSEQILAKFTYTCKNESHLRYGNLVYRKTARNFAPIMATAARRTIAQVSEVVALGTLDPEAVVTPGIFVRSVVPVGALAARSG